LIVKTNFFTPLKNLNRTAVNSSTKLPVTDLNGAPQMGADSNLHGYISTENKQYISENFNPKFALYMALLENICIFLWLFVNKANLSVLVKYMIMIIIFKAIPLFVLKEDIIKIPYDLIPVSGLFVIYMIYLALYNQTVYNIYKTSNEYLVKGENKTPFFETTQWLYDKYIKDKYP